MKCWLFTAVLIAAVPHGPGLNAAPSGRSLSVGARSGGSAKSLARTAAPAPGRPVSDRSYVSFPGVGVRIRKPSGFSEAENFHGFQQPSTSASVMVLRIPGPFSEVTGGFNATQLKTRGIDLRKKEAVKIEGLAGVLVHGTQRAYGITFEKWVLVFGDESQSFMVTATFPQSHRAQLSGSLKAAVLSARLLRTALPDPRADVPFTIAASEKLKNAHGFGKMLAYARDGIFGAARPEDPMFIVGPSLAEAPVEDKRQFALHCLSQTARAKLAAIISHEPIRIDGLDGFESLAEAHHSPSGVPVVIYQVVLYDKEYQYLMVGLVGTTGREEYLPEFKGMARSFKRKRRP